jgi:hypothetical protein
VLSNPDHIIIAVADGPGAKMLSDEMDYISRKLRFFEGPEEITLELVEWVDGAGR